MPYLVTFLGNYFGDFAMGSTKAEELYKAIEDQYFYV